MATCLSLAVIFLPSLRAGTFGFVALGVVWVVWLASCWHEYRAGLLQNTIGGIWRHARARALPPMRASEVLFLVSGLCATVLVMNARP
jgi:hypothetical protein